MTSETPAQTQERIMGYIRSSARKGQETVRDIVIEGHQRLMSSLEGLTVEQAAFKPAEDEWSVLETMRHITEVKEGVGRTCVALARGEAPEEPDPGLLLEWTDKGFSGEPYATPEEARDAAVAAHEAMLAFVDALSEETNVAVTHDHPFVGPMNCLEWAVFQRVHDGSHGAQIDKNKAAAGFPSA